MRQKNEKIPREIVGCRKIHMFINFLPPFVCQMFCSSHFLFLFLVTFGDKITKIQKCYVIFVCILQGKMDKMEKKLERKSRN